MTDNRKLAALAALGSALLLAGAFTFQAFGYAPCHLCLLQRWPHAAAIAFGVIAYVTASRPVMGLGAIAALTTAGIGLYHTGVERGLWIGPTSCTSGSIEGVASDDLLNQIMNAPLVRCNEVVWSLFGLSMASWNAVFSLLLALIWVKAALRR